MKDEESMEKGNAENSGSSDCDLLFGYVFNADTADWVYS
jgi:hypothetical protein